MIDTKKYKEIIESFAKQLIDTLDNESEKKLAKDKWSLREIIGHLVDSASNNHQRFVRLQSGDLLDFPAYDGEEWIRLQKYNGMDWSNLIALWYNYNLMLLYIIENVDKSSLGNTWTKGVDIYYTFEELINKYFSHMEQHIEHFNERREEILKEKKFKTY